MFPDIGSNVNRSDSPHDDPPPRMACALCRRRKLRCNRQLPCDSCTRLGFDCLYSESSRTQPTVRRQRAQKEENRTGASPFGDASLESHSRSVSRKGSHQSSISAAWSADHLTPEEMAELEQTYFRTVHQSIPMLHHFRYNLAIVSEPRLRPPSYLRYIICALGASVSPAYKMDHSALYRASRRALEEAELNDSSLDSIPLARPQSWILIAVYELLQMHTQRWWMSTARAVRLCQMMGLHVIDAARPARRSYHIARDWTELEEQRRTFWMAFVLDRYAAFGYGSPMIIDEKDVHALLPVSEEAYENCTETETRTLNDVLNVETMANLPPMAAAIVLTAETGLKLKLLQQENFTAAGRVPRDGFWQKIHFLDDTLHYAFSVPPHLAASGFAHTPILTFLHMSAPTSTILLHQAAEEQASAHGITPSSLLESQALRLAAAEMVASTMQLASHTDVRLLHPFTGSCLFTAARVLMRSLTVRTDEGKQRSLKVLLDAMGQLQAVNTLTGGYYKDLDTEFPGMRKTLYAQFSQIYSGASITACQQFGGPRSETPSTASSYTPPLPTPRELPPSGGYAVNPGPDLTSEVTVLAPVPVEAGDANTTIDTTYLVDAQRAGSDPIIYFSDPDFYVP